MVASGHLMDRDIIFLLKLPGGPRRNRLTLAPLPPASLTPEQKVKVEPAQRQAGARCALAGALLTGAGEPPAEAGAG